VKSQKPNRTKSIATSILLLAVLFFPSCSWFNNGEQPEKKKTENEHIIEIFNEWYLWYDQLPDIDPEDYESIYDMVDALKADIDRWSFAGSLSQLTALYEQGDYQGLGAGFIIDYDNKIKITHVYSQSPLGRYGVERGWIVESVNGYTIDELDQINKALSSEQEINFVFTDFQSQNHNLTVKKESFHLNTVMHQSIITENNATIGYLVFDSFLDTSAKELETAFTQFKNENITDLIIDLRYNGGGVNNIALMMIAMIGGSKVAGQVITTTLHNDKKELYNSSETAQYDGITLELDRVYFITTKSTASASELLMNSLDPFMEVIQIGSNTHGKPTGMYLFPVEEYDLAVAPVSFKNTNAKGYGDYYNGLYADFDAYDDLQYNWGNTNENMLKTAISHITGNLPAIAATKSQITEKQMCFDYQNIHSIINAY
jgi:C-terminal processing protease CtpA/Prc